MKCIPLLISMAVFLYWSEVPAQSEQQIKNLKTFAKAYGYVKYFHPSDEAAAIDWDAFAIYGASQIEKCDSEEEVLQTLQKLYGPIAPSAKFGWADTPSKYDISLLEPENPTDYELTYWQHKGVSLGMVNRGRPYESVRVNRTTKVENADPFGNVMISFAGDRHRTKTFKYTAWVKMEEGSEGSLWFRVDNSDGSTGFFDNMQNRPITDKEWHLYEITGQIDSLAQSLSFGCFLQGKGKLYFDKAELKIKEGKDWVVVPIENSDFEGGKLGSDKKSAIWNTAGYGYEFSSDTMTKYEGKQSAVIHFVGDSAEVRGKPVFEARPEFGELIEQKLGERITGQIPLVLYADKEHTFPASDQTELATLIGQVEAAPSEATVLAVRLGNVINTYNVFQHFYPYFDVVDVDWDAALEEALDRSFTDKTSEDHLVTLQKLTAVLRDGHISVSLSGTENYTPPIAWEWVEDKLVITYLFNESENLKVGDEVTHTDGQNARDYFEEVHSRISAGTEGWLNYRAKNAALYGPKDSQMTVTVNGKKVEMTRDMDFYRERRPLLPKKDSYKEINDDVFYLNLDLVPMDTINHLMPRLENYRSIICDMRGYPQGNHNFIRHLLKSNDTTEAWMRVPKIVYPDQENITGYETYEWKMKAKKPYLGDKQIIFLTNGRAISYAESFMGYIEGYDLATIVGQPTAGTNGNVNGFNLPGGYRINWTGMKVVKHDGSQHHGIGILPDIYVEKTVDGIVSGKDEFLEKAIELTESEISD
ncbi:MAG TPA: S41 family peptidase [Pricia sp.]|nr:S41 family peptidase [Pricia sp.]